MLHIINLCLVISLVIDFTFGTPCRSSGVGCLTPTTYKICVNVNGDGFLMGEVQTCPENSICDDRAAFPCVAGAIATTTVAPITPPACSGPSKSPADSCFQYYECVQQFFWWTPQLQTCPDGLGFNASSSECVDSDLLGCIPTTTVAPVTPPSTCNGAVKYPGPKENQYYECAFAWFAWRLYTVTCPSGQVYNQALQECFVPAAPITVKPGTNEVCKPNGIQCINTYQYQLCMTINGNGILSDQVYTCPDNKICSDNGKDCACVELPPATTTIAPVTAPPCSGPSKSPATSCEQYYECEQVWWWWEPHLKTCPDGLTFDVITSECIDSGLVDCKPVTGNSPTLAPVTTPLTTTTVAPVTPPACSGAGKYPATSCEQYYECEQVLWWWQPSLKTCQDGLTFDVTTSECINSGLIDCKPTTSVVTTTTTLAPVTTLSTTTLAPVTPPACSGSSKSPADSCEQYYECEQVWWWWEPHLKTCPDGLTFDATTSECINSGLVNCKPTTVVTTTTTTTTSPEPTTPPLTTTPAPVTAPACSGAGKYPGPSCEQYYECEAVMWWWQPTLKNCSDGQTFDDTTKQCVYSGLIDCKPTTSVVTTTTTLAPVTTLSTTTLAPVTPPACYGSSKSPADSCEQYYECEQVWWWWEPHLKTCPDGLTFDATTSECINSGLVNCKPTTVVTTTTTTTTTPEPTTPPLTTTPAPVTAPACSGAGKYPGPSCEQYYECEAVMWWWQPTLKNCPDGQTFDDTTKQCVYSGLVDCKPTTTTTVTTTTVVTTTTPTTTTEAPPTSPSQCTGEAKYPAPAKNQYWECKYVWFQWQLYLSTCPDGQVYNEESQNCVASP